METKIDWIASRTFLWMVRVVGVGMVVISILGLSAIAQEGGNNNNLKGFNSGRKNFNNPFTQTPGTNPFEKLQGQTGNNPPAEGGPGEALRNAVQEAQEKRAGTGNQAAPAPTNPPPQQEPPPSRTPPPSSNITLGNPKDPKDVPDPKAVPGGIEVGGGLRGGVISHSDVPPIEINEELGTGGQEVVTDFNYPDADIIDLAKTIGKLTGKNFIFDKNVKGRISIVSNSPIKVIDAWKAFLTALDVNGYTLIPSGEYTRIARQRDARDKQLNIYTGEFSPNADTLVTRVFPLKHIVADEIARTFRSFMSANSRIIPHSQTNTVIVTDTGSNIAKLAKMLEFLDVEGFDLGIEVIQVKFASAVELAKLVDTLIPDAQEGARKSKRSRIFRRGDGFSARKTKGGGVINNIIGDERSNTLIIHANRKGFDQVKSLVKKLDKRLPPSIGSDKIHVIYLQFADAEEISKTLTNLNSTAKTSRTTTTTGKGGVGVNPKTAELFEGEIKVSADKATNSLVITGSAADFATVQRVINKLDIPRDQVFVEAAIMEMELQKNNNYSANFAYPDKGIALTPSTDLLSFVQNPLGLKGAVFGFKAGSRTIPINGVEVEVGSVQALINAVQTNGLGNVIATPQILTLDNKEAVFETGEKIPVPTSTVSTTGTTTSFTKENVSLKLTIKPQINKKSQYVKLDIKTQLADISQRELPAAVATQALATVERTAETSVIVADGDTVVIGGFLRDKTSETVSKVPLLGDIPLIGWLFKAKKVVATKTNLLMFLTPQIIRQYEKIRGILDRKLKQRDDFIEQTTGGEDPLRKYRDEMIRSLPDIQEVINRNRAGPVAKKDDEDDDDYSDDQPTAGGEILGQDDDEFDEDDGGDDE